MKLSLPDIWPVPPKLGSDDPPLFEIEGVRVTRTSDRLWVENLRLRKAVYAVPIFVALGFPFACILFVFCKALLMHRGHVHVHLQHALPFAIIEFIAWYGISALAMYLLVTPLVRVTNAWVLLLEKSDTEKSKPLLNWGTIQSITGLRVRRISTRRGGLYSLSLTLSTSSRFLFWTFKDCCRFAVFCDKANAERVAQVIADFANVPIKPRNM